MFKIGDRVKVKNSYELNFLRNKTGVINHIFLENCIALVTNGQEQFLVELEELENM